MLIASTAILKPMTALPVKLPVVGSVAPAKKLAMASLGKYAKMAAVPTIILVGIQTLHRSRIVAKENMHATVLELVVL
jgi:hypothetical protein